MDIELSKIEYNLSLLYHYKSLYKFQDRTWVILADIHYLLKYRLEDLDGEESYYVEGFAKWPDVFNALKPVCPKCKNSLLPSNLV